MKLNIHHFCIILFVNYLLPLWSCFHTETSRTFVPTRESKTHPHPHHALSCIEYSALLQVLVSGNRRSVILQPLLSDTRYKITVTPIYADEESTALSMSSSGKTSECERTNATGVIVNEIHYGHLSNPFKTDSVMLITYYGGIIT